jgi:hypothetical protein
MYHGPEVEKIFEKREKIPRKLFASRVKARSPGEHNGDDVRRKLAEVCKCLFWTCLFCYIVSASALATSVAAIQLLNIYDAFTRSCLDKYTNGGDHPGIYTYIFFPTTCAEVHFSCVGGGCRLIFALSRTSGAIKFGNNNFRVSDSICLCCCIRGKFLMEDSRNPRSPPVIVTQRLSGYINKYNHPSDNETRDFFNYSLVCLKG